MFRTEAATAARRLSASVLAGAVLGLVLGGAGARLSMMLLAALNDETHGVVTDDGFEVGQLTLSGTLNLLLIGTLLGGFGGLVYHVLRPLLLGPRGFRVLSVAVGAGVMVGAALVHVDGVDFRLLDPAWLAIGIFVAIPALHGALLVVLAERWHASGWVERVPALAAYLPLLVLAPIAPPLLLVVAGWLVLRAARHTSVGERLTTAGALTWAVRAVLVVVFVVGLRDLVGDVVTLT